MSDEIEYIEPTQEHVGQIVEVRHPEMNTYRARKLLAVLPHPIKYRFVCQDSVDNVSSSHWMHARIPRPLTYAERQARCGLKVGDRVRIARGWLPMESGFGTATFLPHMEKLIGTKWDIVSIESSCIILKGIALLWPYFVLEKVEDRLAVHDDYGKTVYVADCPQDRFKLVTTFCEVITEPHSCTWFGVVRSGDKRFVYELSNLRVKE